MLKIDTANNITIFNSSKPSIGLYVRNTTNGDEHALVSQFIDYYCSVFKRNNKKTQLAVFIEPRIDSGFPDIVFASYKPSIIDNWSNEREKLDIYDLKLLSYIFIVSGENCNQITERLGFPENQVVKSLEKLLDSKLIVRRSGGWHTKQVNDVFSIKKLIAVEAKINAISSLVTQSYVNTRFASHSYALSNSARPHHGTINAFSKYGIGLYCKGKRFIEYLEAKQHNLPTSYVSFQFNEWIGRALAN